MLSLKGVTKKYSKVVANDNISMTVSSGEIAVLLGPNGAGKSTLIKSVCGLVRFEGEILIDGFKNKTPQARQRLGYVPEIPAVYDLLTVSEHIEFILRAYQSGDREYAEQLLRRFELFDKSNALGRELSKGMQQKLSICCALAHKPAVVVFDEPMVGLDPHAIKELNLIFGELRQQGCTVLISTHMLGSVDGLWDSAYIMKSGRLCAEKRAGEKGDKTLEQMFFEITEGGEEK